MNALDLTYALGAIVLAPIWARKTRGGWRERFGHTPALPRSDASKPRILIHAVSVGEVNTLARLVPDLRRHAEVIVSASTDTGLARAKLIFGQGEYAGHVVRYPLDFSSSVRRFLDALQIDAAILVELEVWPNFIRQCQERSIPVAVINGRLSARSYRGYQRLRPFLCHTFARLSFAAVQDEDYAKRFIAMGTPRDRCTVTGSMKWDTALDAMRQLQAGSLEQSAAALAADLGIDRTRPVIVAGSTAEGEERLLHQSCPVGVQLICAPRKPERFDQAAADMPMCTRRSMVKQTRAMRATRPRGHTDRFLLDTLGELRAAYALADVVVIGRSFTPLGGSDPLEPIGLGKPTLIGPHFANFTSIVQRLKADGVLRIVHPGELRTAFEQLLRDKSERQRLAELGKAAITRNAGATDRHLDMILKLVKDKRPVTTPAPLPIVPAESAT